MCVHCAVQYSVVVFFWRNAPSRIPNWIEKEFISAQYSHWAALSVSALLVWAAVWFICAKRWTLFYDHFTILPIHIHLNQNPNSQTNFRDTGCECSPFQVRMVVLESERSPHMTELLRHSTETCQSSTSASLSSGPCPLPIDNMFVFVLLSAKTNYFARSRKFPNNYVYLPYSALSGSGHFLFSISRMSPWASLTSCCCCHK